MKKYRKTNVNVVPKQSSQIVSIHNEPGYGHSYSITNSYNKFQSQSLAKTWTPENRIQQEKTFLIDSSENINFASNDTSKNTNNKHQCWKVFQIIWILILTILTLAALSIGIYELVVSNMKATTSDLVTTTSATIANLSQCYTYTIINDPTRLSTAAGGVASDVLSFSTTYTWYRFYGSGGSQITTIPPAFYRCGGSYSGWYASMMPTYGNTLIGTVCYVHTNICYYTNNILVTNCGLYYVYALINSPVAFARYCTV